MSNPDPIADNQTSQTIIALMNGSADDTTRDHATAALLASVQKLITKTADIERNLWSPVELEKVIDARHRLACQNCPTKQYVTNLQKSASGSPKKEDGKKSAIISILSNPTTLLAVILAAICLMLTVSLMYKSIGPQGFHDVTDAVHLTKGSVQ